MLLAKDKPEELKELDNLDDNNTLLTAPQEIYSDDDVYEEPVPKKKKVSTQSIIDRFDELITSCAERNFQKTVELLKKSITAFKSEDKKDNNSKASTSIQMTMLDCFRPRN